MDRPAGRPVDREYAGKSCVAVGNGPGFPPVRKRCDAVGLLRRAAEQARLAASAACARTPTALHRVSVVKILALPHPARTFGTGTWPQSAKMYRSNRANTHYPVIRATIDPYIW